MAKFKRICGIGALVCLILLSTAAAPRVLASPISLAKDLPIAQSELPNVLVPSAIPPAEPSIPEATATPQPNAVSTNGSNSTAAASVHSGLDFSKVVGSVPPYFIIALIPLLFVIGALFYFFFMGDQERGASSEEKEASTQFTENGEDTGWRELK